MSFMKKLSGSLQDLKKTVEKQIEQHVPSAKSSTSNLHQTQGQSRELIIPNDLPFAGPFLKYGDSDLNANVNRYSVMIVAPPHFTETPNLRLSVGQVLGQPILLDTYADHRFWRMDFAIPLTDQQQRVNYSVSNTKEVTFVVPAREQTYKW
jgi:hypothetical protein